VRLLLCVSLSIFCACQPEKKEKSTFPNLVDSLNYVNRDFKLKKLNNKDSALKAYRLDTLFSRVAKEKGINGNILIAQGNTILYKGSMGFANKDLQAPLSDSSLFQLASVSKTLTGVLILKLQSQNILNVKDKVSQYIKNWPYPEMTIHHLLCHRSGLKSYTNIISDSLKYKDKKYSNQLLVEFYVRNKPDLEFAINDRFNYCNTNYVLLAAIAEIAGKQAFFTLLKNKILIPTGMRHTFLRDSIPLLASMYKTEGHYNNYELLRDDYFENVVGDKGIYTCTSDLFLFSKALYTNVLLSNSITNEMYTSYSPERKYGTYGYGWRMFSDSLKMDKKYVFHNGWWHGYRNAFHRRLDDETTIIILSNRLNRAVYNVKAIFNAIDGIVPLANEDEEDYKDE
jgi:CubicO group peptidase (beta-lactamase class C family)